MLLHNVIDERTHRGLTISLYHDEDCSSPRENNNLGTIIAWHRRYSLSDDDAPKHLEPEDFDPKAYAVCLPVFMYEHSGVALSTGDFGDKWDSGQVGWIYVTRDKMLREMQANYATKQVIAKTINILKCEIDEYGKYVNGECYGYGITDDDGEQLDSCGGFMGSEFCWEEATRAADYEADAMIKRADAFTDTQRSEN